MIFLTPVYSFGQNMPYYPAKPFNLNVRKFIVFSQKHPLFVKKETQNSENQGKLHSGTFLKSKVCIESLCFIQYE